MTGAGNIGRRCKVDHDAVFALHSMSECDAGSHRETLSIASFEHAPSGCGVSTKLSVGLIYGRGEQSNTLIGENRYRVLRTKVYHSCNFASFPKAVPSSLSPSTFPFRVGSA